MPIIRKQLKPADVYPDGIRYNSDTGQVQTLVNGTWTDSPQADPRTQTIFPPRATADPRCDAAASVQVAFKAQIDGVLAAIDGSQTAFTIAGIILSLFSFGVFGIFISLALFLAHSMLDAGTAAINAALTSDAYDKFKCILYCHMDSSGRVKSGEFGEIQTDVTDQIGGLGATILNAMLSLAGEGGVNNIASLGMTTGDCSSCECGDPCPDLPDWQGQLPGTLGTITATDPDGRWIEVTSEFYSGTLLNYCSITTFDPALCCKLTNIEMRSAGGTFVKHADGQTLCGAAHWYDATNFDPVGESICYVYVTTDIVGRVVRFHFSA